MYTMWVYNVNTTSTIYWCFITIKHQLTVLVVLTVYTHIVYVYEFLNVTAGDTLCFEGLITRKGRPLHILQASHPFVSHSLSISFKINSLLYYIAFSFQSIDEPFYNLPFESYTESFRKRTRSRNRKQIQVMLCMRKRKIFKHIKLHLYMEFLTFNASNRYQD